MVEKQQREDHRERDPDGELLVNRHAGKGIQNEKARHRNGDSGCVIDINCAYEIALLTFKLQAAVETMAVHGAPPALTSNPVRQAQGRPLPWRARAERKAAS